MEMSLPRYLDCRGPGLVKTSGVDAPTVSPRAGPHDGSPPTSALASARHGPPQLSIAKVKALNILRLVVASPGDVKAERDAVETAATEINKGIGEELGFHVQVSRWETDAYPGFHAKGPQGQVDSALRIEDCDVLVGIFWKRFGTPTLGAGSGTEHEIQVAHERWRQSRKPRVMLYFSQAPYSVKSTDELRQWERVLEFKQASADWGLWWPYDNASSFEGLFRQHLTSVLREMKGSALGPKTATGTKPRSEKLPDRTAYLARYVRLISQAQREIFISTSKFHKTGEVPEAQKINSALREARAKGVQVQVLLADGYDRLPGALQLAGSLGIPVRFDPGIHTADLNFACFDGKVTIVAMRQPSAPADLTYSPSFSWLEFWSEGITLAMAELFRQRWTSVVSSSVVQHMREELPRIVAASSISNVSKQLDLPEELVARYCLTTPFTVFLIGRPGSGKSTIARAIQEVAAQASVFRPVVWLSDVGFLWDYFVGSAQQGSRAERTQDGGFYITDDGLYDDAMRNLARGAKREGRQAGLLVLEFARNNYEKAFGILDSEGVSPDLVVYLDIDMDNALLRNRKRKIEGGHYVSEREMLSYYTSDDLHEITSKLGSRLLIVSQNELPNEAARRKASEILERMKDRFK